MNPEDPSLVDLCRFCRDAGDSDAWSRLIARIQQDFARIAFRVSRAFGPANMREIDDIIQESLLKLGANGGEALRRVPADDDAAALAYLRAMAANCARDYFRARYAAKRGVDQTVNVAAPMEALAGALGANESIERNILLREVDESLPADLRQRAIFWLYYRDGLTAKEIAGIPGVSLAAKGVESLLHRLTASVRETFRTSAGARRILTKGEPAP